MCMHQQCMQPVTVAPAFLFTLTFSYLFLVLYFVLNVRLFNRFPFNYVAREFLFYIISLGIKWRILILNGLLTLGIQKFQLPSYSGKRNLQRTSRRQDSLYSHRHNEGQSGKWDMGAHDRHNPRGESKTEYKAHEPN